MRLGKQRTEAKQILNAIEHIYNGDNAGYMNHPATLMWLRYEDALKHYLNLCIDEWERRGNTNNMDKVHIDCPVDDIEMPWYIGWYHFHKSHQASLYRKHPAYYVDKFRVQNSTDTGIDGYLEDFYIERGYVWPSHHDTNIDTVLSLSPNVPDASLDTYRTGTKPLFAPINLDTMKNASESRKRLYRVVDLKVMAKDRGIKGAYKMNKDQLLLVLGIDTDAK